MRKSTALTRNAGEDFGTKALDFQKKTPHLIGSFLQNETSRLLLIFQCSCFQSLENVMRLMHQYEKEKNSGLKSPQVLWMISD